MDNFKVRSTCIMYVCKLICLAKIIFAASFLCLSWSFTAQSTTRSCRAGQLIVALFLGRLRPSKRLTSTKPGRPRQ